jgi:hypothetical protein
LLRPSRFSCRSEQIAGPSRDAQAAFAEMAVGDQRSAEEIIGYDQHGLPDWN